MEAQPTPGTRKSQLRRLLLQSFSADELLLWLSDLTGDKNICFGKLTTVSVESYYHEVIETLDRHGLITPSIIDSIIAIRPHRADILDSFKTSWLMEIRQMSSSQRQELELASQLEELYRQREALAVNEEGTEKIDAAILQVRSRIRRGAVPVEGDLLLSGRYRLVKQVGVGGFATVWKAYDRRSKQIVAIKILHSQWRNDATRIERFIRGANEMGKLVHPNIVRVISEYCHEDGYYFFVMEYVSGGSLYSFIQESSVTTSQIKNIMLKVAEALSFAHKRGVIHRDVKPQNVLICKDGNPKITDFDLVKAFDTTGGTRTGALGSFLYAAPEATSDAKSATELSDIFGWGMTFLYCLQGRDLSVHSWNNIVTILDSMKGDIDGGTFSAVLWSTSVSIETRCPSAIQLTHSLNSDGVSGHPDWIVIEQALSGNPTAKSVLVERSWSNSRSAVVQDISTMVDRLPNDYERSLTISEIPLDDILSSAWLQYLSEPHRFRGRPLVRSIREIAKKEAQLYLGIEAQFEHWGLEEAAPKEYQWGYDVRKVKDIVEFGFGGNSTLIRVLERLASGHRTVVLRLLSGASIPKISNEMGLSEEQGVDLLLEVLGSLVDSN